MIEILGNIALWPAEQLINAAIHSDRHVSKKVASFDGKAIQVIATSPALPDFNLRIVFESDSLRLTAVDSEFFELPFDAAIKGPVSLLLQQLVSDHSQTALAGSELELSGDVQLVQDLFSAMKSLDLDWQDYLAPVLGDVLTHQLSESVAQTTAWAEDSRRRMGSSLDDYLREEIRVFPSRQEIENFSSDLDQLRLRIDRAQARAARLQSRLAALNTGSDS